MTEYTSWAEVKKKGRRADPRTPAAQASGKAAAADHQDGYIRGHQLAEMRKAAGITQATVTSQASMSFAPTSRPSAAPSRSWPLSATGAGKSPEPRVL